MLKFRQPTHLPTHLPTHPPTNPPTHNHATTHQPTYPPTDLPTNPLPTNPPTTSQQPNPPIKPPPRQRARARPPTNPPQTKLTNQPANKQPKREQALANRSGSPTLVALLGGQAPSGASEGKGPVECVVWPTRKRLPLPALAKGIMNQARVFICMVKNNHSKHARCVPHTSRNQEASDAVPGKEATYIATTSTTLKAPQKNYTGKIMGGRKSM